MAIFASSSVCIINLMDWSKLGAYIWSSHAHVHYDLPLPTVSDLSLYIPAYMNSLNSSKVVIECMLKSWYSNDWYDID